MEKRKSIYRKLFSSTFYISAFTFGGGYVIIPLMKKKFVEGLKWIEEDEMLNLIAIAQSSPGPIAVNTSVLIGYNVAGLVGALVSLWATILPPMITLSVISMFYSAFIKNAVISAIMKGMQAGVAAVITDAVLNLGSNVAKKKELISVLIMLIAFIMTFFLKVNVVLIILFGGLIGTLKVVLHERRNKGGGE
ncbi:MAG: chromate transporter [Clostridiaceae bacterium]|nr:chromate transporter [Clostridiaceae bacterium]